jgi:hypothetical protein
MTTEHTCSGRPAVRTNVQGRGSVLVAPSLEDVKWTRQRFLWQAKGTPKNASKQD